MKIVLIGTSNQAEEIKAKLEEFQHDIEIIHVHERTETPRIKYFDSDEIKIGFDQPFKVTEAMKQRMLEMVMSYHDLPDAAVTEGEPATKKPSYTKLHGRWGK